MAKKWNPWRYIKNYKFKSLFLNNFLLILLIILVPIWCFCICVFYYFQYANTKDINRFVYDDLIRVQETIDTVELNVQTLGTSLATESFIGNIVKTQYGERISFEEAMELRMLIKNVFLMSNEYIQSIYIYSSCNDYVVSMDSATKSSMFYDMKWLRELEENTAYGGMYTWGRVREQKIYESPGIRKTSPCITTGISIPVVKDTAIDGYIVINIDNRWIDRLVSNNSEYQQDFFIIGTNGRVLYSKDEERIGESAESFYENLYLADLKDSERDQMLIIEEDHKQYFLNYSESLITGWNYLYITDMQAYQEKLDGISAIIRTVIILLTLVSIVVAYFISIKVFLPIKKIIEMIEDPLEFYQMNSKENAQKGIYNELKYITASFMNNLTQNEKSNEELTNYVTKLKETQVSLLQTQINPHFIFNTFQTINFMAIRMIKSDNEVSRAIEKLSVMLRNIMEVDCNFFSVQQEIQYCKAYIELEQLRYQNEFTVHWEIDDEIAECLITKISLQPLLENCIRHGFKNKKEGEEIIVEGKQIENKLYFTVTDNGQGQEQQWIEAMNQELDNFNVIVGKHIGIRNVNQRIKLLFGIDYGIHIHPVLEGFSIGIALPVIFETEY